jgi:hypothetical protein
VLKPGGILSITEVALDPHRQDMDTIRRLAQAAGFVEQARVSNGLQSIINFVKPT